jgi:diguanylate cyclase (GGDEF)-like protein
MEQMIYLYIFAIAILITIFISMLKHPQNNIFAEKLYRRIVLFSVMMLLIDIAHEYLSGIEGLWNAVLIRVLSVLIYAFPTVIAVIWFIYSYFLIHREKPKNSLYFHLYLLPMAINIILSLGSLIWPFYFDITQNNVYQRGQIYFLSIVLQYFYMIAPIFMVLKNRSRLRSDKLYPLIFFTVPPMIGGLIQAFNYGVLLIWPMLAFSIFVSYIFIQSKLISIDYLTGVMNKGAFENHIDNIVYLDKHEKILSVTLMDLDGLKLINDNYGHLEGDKVLKTFAELLVKSFKRNDYIARIGGDEFVVIKYIRTTSEIENCLLELKNNIKSLNSSGVFPASISYSSGYDIYDINEHLSIKDLIARVDKIMYETKSLKKNTR